MSRFVKAIIIGQEVIDGAGVKLKRILGSKTTREFDPFLMLDAFDSQNPIDYIKGFPWHPHRGIETITYLIKGEIEHADSLGNQGIISNGSCQWMTAGSGILHWEMPKPTEHFLGIQLWLNLPMKDKYAHPRYFSIDNERIPEVIDDISKVRVISGQYKGYNGPARGDYVEMMFLDVTLGPQSEWVLDLPPDDTCFSYIIDGEIVLGDKVLSRYEKNRVLLFSTGSDFKVSSSKAGARFLLFSAKSINEPIAWGGGIVLNFKQELEEAFHELELETFIKDSPRL